MTGYEIQITESTSFGLDNGKWFPTWNGAIVYIEDDGTVTRTGLAVSYFQKDDPDKRRTRGGLFRHLGNVRRYLERTGKRWEIEQAAERNAKRQAKQAADAARLRLRNAAPAMLNALRAVVTGSTGVFGQDSTGHDYVRLRAASLEAVQAAIALATTDTP